MNRINIPFLSLPALCIVLLTATGIAGQGVRIARYWAGKKAAVSFTFDDGSPSHCTIAAPMFDSLGLKATFYVNPGDAEWAEFRKLALSGHEIGNHSMTHVCPFCIVTDPAVLQREVVASRDSITKNIGVVPMSFAHPCCCSFSDRQIRAYVLVYYPVDRLCGEMYLHPDNIDKALRGELDTSQYHIQKDWLILLAHDVSDPGNRDGLRTTLRYANARQDSLWIGTYANIGRYVRERDSASLEVLAQTATNITLRLRLLQSMRPDWYTVPLTVRIPVNADTVMTDVIPDGQTVTVNYSDCYKKGKITRARPCGRPPRSVGGTVPAMRVTAAGIRFSYVMSADGHVLLRVSDAAGRVVAVPRRADGRGVDSSAPAHAQAFRQTGRRLKD